MKKIKIILFILLLVNFFSGYSQKKNEPKTTADPGLCDLYVYVDMDGDGYGTGNSICINLILDDVPYSLVGGDCDDTNPNVTITQFWYQDIDGDGFGGLSTTTKVCYPPAGYTVTIGGDCADNNGQINPNTNWYLDSDNDGFGASGIPAYIGCFPPVQTSLYTLDHSDCDDSNAQINPNSIWYQDLDGDGYGNIAVTLTQCQQPTNYVSNKEDCDDNNVNLHVINVYYADTDGDSFGDPNNPINACLLPVGYVTNNLDNCPTIAGPNQGCVVPTSSPQNSDRNYIITTSPKVPVNSLQAITNISDVVVNITYFDELGKPNQQIASEQSATGKNIVTHIEYDSYNREVKKYLPYVENATGIAFVSNALTNTLNYTDYVGQLPYSETLFESSPLNRVLKQAAPGTINDWAMGGNHEVRTDNLTNVASEVKYYATNALWNTTSKLYDISLSSSGTTYYAAGELYKTVVKDENWVSGKNNTTEEFKNKEGKVVLKRTYDNTIAHDTYYVYDQYSNLTYVIPPLVTNVTSQLDGLCYQYKYDVRNRLVEKKVPGKQWEFIVYDKLDRVVATGPALSPFSDLSSIGWMITKYDVFNRPIITAWLPTTVTATTRTSLQTTLDSASVLNETKNATSVDSPLINGVACRYSNLAYPTSGYHVLTVNYYDDYNFSFAPTTIPTTVEFQTVYYNNTTKPKGLATGSWVRILQRSGDYKHEKSYILYDNKARAIRTYKSNDFFGGFIQVDSNLQPITGRTNYTITSFNKTSTSSSTVTTKDEFVYSSQDRLLIQTQKINSLPKQLIFSNTYNELGTLISKKVGGADITGSAGLQEVNYTYNIRNWLTEINNANNMGGDLFAFKINYNNIQNENGYTGKALFNGNIAETYWKTKTDMVLRKYGYFYDNLNRLKSAVYQKPGNAIPVPNSYNESIDYDKNGNITKLVRNGNQETLPVNEIDNLKYIYETNTNKLIKVDEIQPTQTSGFKDGSNLAIEYAYDANGNMISDANKGITKILYNHLNLPVKITFGTTGTIEYFYNALGQKTQKKVTQLNNPIITDYVDGFQYLNNVLQFFPTAEGYVTGAYKYVFQYKDHLGNVRLSYSDTSGDGVVTGNEIIEESHYYPFGLKHSGYNSTVLSGYAEAQKYKFQGQERQDELGLNWDSFKWRNYDSSIGRFMSIDPLSEEYAYQSHYNFSENRVIDWRELEGLEGTPTQQWNGAFKQMGQAFLGTIDKIGAKVSAFFSVSRDVAPNTKVVTTTTASAQTNFLNWANAKQFDQSTTVSPFIAKVDTKVEVKTTVVDKKAKVQGVDVGLKVTNTTDVTTGTNKTENKGTIGVGSNGVFVTNTTNTTTNENTTRAGVQVQVETPKVQNTTLTVGANISVGQEEKKASN